MKKIKVKTAITPDKSSIITQQKCFTILLGNGTQLNYTTHKDMKFALAEVNRQLNLIMFELNEMYIYAFSEYRRIWFYMETKYSRERSIIEYNQDIQKAFSMLAERSSWGNGNVFSFKHLFTICASLASELEIMADIRRTKKQFIEFHLLQMKIRNVERISDELKKMSIDAKYSADARK